MGGSSPAGLQSRRRPTPLPLSPAPTFNLDAGVPPDTSSPDDGDIIESSEVRDVKVWGERAAHGSPIRKSLRPRRALMLLGGACLALFTASADPTHRALLAEHTVVKDPKTRAEALATDHDGWTKSMDTEIEAHRVNKSWEWVRAEDVPNGRRLIKLIWVFKVKRNGKLKSRLCVQGCNQVEGIDYDQTFSAALRAPSLRVIASLASRHNLKLHRWDFVSAYLQGELEEGEVVYCHPPKGYERFDEDGHRMVCKVVKPIYGMAQAGRRWQRSLFPWLLKFGFKQSEHDPCIFHLHQKVNTPKGPRDERLVVGVYVDDLCCAYSHGDKYSLYSRFVDKLHDWKVEDEGPLHDLLNVEFSQSDGIVELRQTGYIATMISRFLPEGIPANVQANRTPCDANLPMHVLLALEQSSPPDAALLKEYQSLVGALLYASTHTRPDIAFAVGMLCRAMAKPTPALLDDAKRVLMYLGRTRELGLRYTASDRALYGMTDSDWATRHSTSGHVFILNEAAISWGSKKQSTVALSSCEAEIVAASEAAKEAISLSGLASELGLHDGSPVDMYMDNQSGIHVSYNPEHQGRMKHVERRHFFVRECVENHQIRVPFVRTTENIADFFTKPLHPRQFYSMRDTIMNVSHSRR